MTLSLFANYHTEIDIDVLYVEFVLSKTVNIEKYETNTTANL